MKKLKLFLNKISAKPAVRNFIAPLLRGVLKTVPGGNVAVEVVQNYLADKEQRPHNYFSIVLQAAGIAAILYAFYTGQITVEGVLNLLKQFSE